MQFLSLRGPRPETRAKEPAMKYVNLGKSGLKVSQICLGTMTFGTRRWNEWVLSEEDSRPLIRKALELGINFFDTADVYSCGLSEEILGGAIREFVARDQVILATKVHGPVGPGPNDRGLSRKHILDAVDASLRRLGTNYIDLYQIHRWDYETPLEETLDVLHDLVKSGKVRYIGASSMSAWQFAKSLYLADSPGVGPVRLHAEPLQPGLSRGRTRNDSPLPGRGNRRFALESIGAGLSGRQSVSPGRRPDLACPDR